MWIYYGIITLFHTLWHINKNRKFYKKPDSVTEESSRATHFIFYTLRLGYIPVFWSELTLAEIVATILIAEIARLVLVGFTTLYFIRKSSN